MRHEIKWFLSLKVQICLLSSVEFLRRACRNEVVWSPFLALKSNQSIVCFCSVIVAPGDGGLVED